MTSLYVRKPETGLSVFNDFDRILDSFFNDVPVWNARVPSVDIREEDEKYVFEAELPGVNEKDIDVKVEGNLLTLSTKKEKESEEKRKGFILKERSAEAFSRSFVLPKNADSGKVEGSYKNGILTLEIAKHPETKPRQIEIKGV
jgi:HSP20 family protein